MKKVSLSLLFSLAITFFLFAQDLTTEDEQKKNTILFAPLNLFDVVNPSVQIGYDRLLNKRFAYQVEVAYIISHSVEEYIIDWARGVKDCEYDNKGFKLRNELKFIFLKRRKLNLYTSVEAFYLRNRSTRAGTFLMADTTFEYSTPRPEGTDGYDELFTIDKQKAGLNLKFGLNSSQDPKAEL